MRQPQVALVAAAVMLTAPSALAFQGIWKPTPSFGGRALSRPVSQFWTGSHFCNQRAFSPANVAATKASAPAGVKGGAGDDENFDEVNAKIQVTGKDIEVTPAMRDYVYKKLGKVLSKGVADKVVQKVDVHLSVVNTPKHKQHLHTAEATVFMKGGQVLRSSEETDYMYASIDLVSHRLARHLRRFKDRKLAVRKDAKFAEAAPDDILEAMAAQQAAADGDFEDPAKAVDLRLVKTKSFDMPPMTVEDAIVCLDYIGHDFYVFRNDKTKDINVVYKRKQGGVGLIEPGK